MFHLIRATIAYNSIHRIDFDINELPPVSLFTHPLHLAFFQTHGGRERGHVSKAEDKYGQRYISYCYPLN
jgi:hypothetical protein